MMLLLGMVTTHENTALRGTAAPAATSATAPDAANTAAPITGPTAPTAPPAAAPAPVASAAAPAPQVSEQQRQLETLMRNALALTQQQLAALPPDQRQKIQILRNKALEMGVSTGPPPNPAFTDRPPPPMPGPQDLAGLGASRFAPPQMPAYPTGYHG